MMCTFTLTTYWPCFKFMSKTHYCPALLVNKGQHLVGRFFSVVN